MSRLGETIQRERARQGISAKALGKKCGVSEGYIIEVESGRRILNDEAAARIMKVLGASVPPNEAFHEEEQVRKAPVVRQEAPAQPADPTEAWQSALASIIRAVPVLDAYGHKKAARQLPVEGGKVEGYSADRVFYLEAWDDALAEWRIRKGDWIFIAPEKEPVYGPILYVAADGRKVLCRMRKLEGNRLALLGPRGQEETQPRDKVQVLGRCVRVEVQL